MSANTLDVRNLSVADIRVDEASQLRVVNKDTDQYSNLRNDMEANGLRQPIEVREARDGGFIVVAGHHRFEAAVELGWDTIPASVQAFESGEDVIIRQMMENENRVNAKPAEFGKGVLAILNANPNWTVQDVADRLGVSESYVTSRIGIVRKLSEAAQEYCNANDVSLSNMVQLSKLPLDEQTDYCERAGSESAEDFASEVALRLTNIRKANSVLDSGNDSFVPTPKLRKRGEINDEFLAAKVAFNGFRVDADTINQETAEYAAGRLEGIAFALSLDSDTVELAKAEFEEALADKREKQLNKQQAKMGGEVFANAPAMPSDL